MTPAFLLSILLCNFDFLINADVFFRWVNHLYLPTFTSPIVFLYLVSIRMAVNGV